MSKVLSPCWFHPEQPLVRPSACHRPHRLCVCVCACVRVCMRACVCVRACVCACIIM